VARSGLDSSTLIATRRSQEVIARDSRANRLGENLAAANPELTPDDVRTIESASAQIKIEGARYSDLHKQLPAGDDGSPATGDRRRA
jgi:hypothetical protein